ncbi:MAG: DnaJ family molecular chaperone [Actinomycetota bacterium]
MHDPFADAAGPTPPRGDSARWRQVALLAGAASLGDRAARPRLAAVLQSLDHPVEAGRALAAAPDDDPWTRWWAVLAVGQGEGAEGLDEALAAARAVTPEGPDGREVARRLDDLAAELAALRGDADADARFALIGHRAQPDRRVMLAGRSSAAFIVDPSWDSLALVRLAPSDGPSMANSAHHQLDEVIALVRQGQSGQGRPVPGDAPAAADPEVMLELFRHDSASRDRALASLAEEVREERARLAERQEAIDDEWGDIQAEKARLRALAQGLLEKQQSAAFSVPTSAAEAADLLGLGPRPSPDEVERAWRRQVARCHPDRVADLHPDLQQRAADMTVALNGAREILLGKPSAARRR